MPTDESWRRFLDAGTLIGQVSMARAEEISWLSTTRRPGASRARPRGDGPGRAQDGEQFVTLARAELTKQLEGVGSFDQLVDRLSDLFGKGDRPDAEGPAPGDRSACADLLDGASA